MIADILCIKANKLEMSILFSRILNIHMLEYHCSFYSTNTYLLGTENLIGNCLHPSTAFSGFIKLFLDSDNMGICLY